MLVAMPGVHLQGRQGPPPKGLLLEDTGAKNGRRRADTDTLNVAPPGPHIGVKVTDARVK